MSLFRQLLLQCRLAENVFGDFNIELDFGNDVFGGTLLENF
jgi:hypothetical protein